MVSFDIIMSLSMHAAYTTPDYVDERERLVFTRFRLSSHHLKIETGRWARIEVEKRVCDCGLGIQDELHVLLKCAKTEEVRGRFGISVGDYNNLGELMDKVDVHVLVSFVYNCMKLFG